MSILENEVIYDKGFLKDASDLPAALQKELSELIEILKQNPFDHRLHTKQLGAPLQGMFSFRITRGYRVGFRFCASHKIQLLAVDRRDKIYKRLERRL